METPSSTSSFSTNETENSRRDHEAERARKKPKMDPPTFSDAGTVVKLLIGDEKNPAEKTVHKEIACNGSPVFRVAFCGNFSESQSLTYKLPHVDNPTAAMLIQWLYSHKLVVAQLKDDYSGDVDMTSEEDETLIDLWVLADELQMPALQNATIKAIHEVVLKTNQMMDHTNKEKVFNVTAEGSQLRRYISHYEAFNNEPGDYKAMEDQYPYDMLIEIAEYYCERGNDFDKKFELSDYFLSEE